MAEARVLYLQFANPGAYPPIEHGALILAEGGARVHLVGTRPRAGGAIELASHPRISVTLIREREGVLQKLAFAWFTLVAVWTAVRFRPTWLYVSDLFATPAGLLASSVSAASVIYHEHDIHSDPRPSAFVRLCFAARHRLARRLRCAVAPGTARAHHLQTALGITSVHVVLNCPRRSEVRHGAPPSGVTLRVFYHGTLVRQRLPLHVADAIAALGGAATLTVAGYEPPGAEGHVRALAERAAERGAPDAVHYAGVIPTRHELLDLCATFDVGLALVPAHEGDVNMRTMAGASNKAFDYLACGLALVVTDVEDWRRMFVDAGYACAVEPDDAESLRMTLEWCMHHRDQLRAMGAAGRERVLAEWNYETQFAFLRDQVLAGSSANRASVQRTAA